MIKLVVLCSFAAVAVAKPSVIAPVGLAGWAGHLAAPWGSHIATPLVAAAPVLGAHNYRGPLSLAPGQPANILAADGRPLDTLSVNHDRAVHFTAKALEHGGVHLLKKRSAVLAPAVAWSHVARVDWPAARLVAHAPIAPLGLAAPVGHWGLGHAAHLTHIW
ncbi:cuticular protein hypothetical 9 precursor [Bombyx mori]|uniref:Putative cuticle protein n=1 Tax=Bombyx mori TaxID=7091 RepID=C0H6G5_BOMMO|nr:cuticular protein hypothetical 9 precursor [Bombyx mori]FAA00476.1 TPA: putative cuticle protein [Bombyx mori]